MQRFLSIGVMAHVDAGKTTFSEQLLYHTGSIRTRGRVDHQDAFLDNDRLERERGITIFSNHAPFSIGEHQYWLLDTPGHVDFSAEMGRTPSRCGSCSNAMGCRCFSFSTRPTGPVRVPTRCCTSCKRG